MGIGYEGLPPGETPQRAARMDRTFAGTNPAKVHTLLAEIPVGGFDTRAALAISATAALLALAGRAYRSSRPTASQHEGLQMGLGILLTHIDAPPNAPAIDLAADRPAVDTALPGLLASANGPRLRSRRG